MQGSGNPPPDGNPQRAEGQDSEKSTVEPKINSCSQLLLTNSMRGNRPEREVDLSSLLDCLYVQDGVDANSPTRGFWEGLSIIRLLVGPLSALISTARLHDGCSCLSLDSRRVGKKLTALQQNELGSAAAVPTQTTIRVAIKLKAIVGSTDMKRTP